MVHKAVDMAAMVELLLVAELAEAVLVATQVMVVLALHLVALLL
jgi:hypothetical protein